MERLWPLVAVSVGGAAGALLRWALSVGFQRFSTTNFPLGTLAANLLGCLAVGLGYGWLVERAVHPTLRLGIMVGFLGALTTFSTWNLETLLLLEQRRYGATVLNLAGSLGLGLLAVMLGMMLSRRI